MPANADGCCPAVNDSGSPAAFADRVAAFRPEVLVTQHGADSHAEDPLADLNLTVDGHVRSDGPHHAAILYRGQDPPLRD